MKTAGTLALTVNNPNKANGSATMQCSEEIPIAMFKSTEMKKTKNGKRKKLEAVAVIKVPKIPLVCVYLYQ